MFLHIIPPYWTPPEKNTGENEEFCVGVCRKKSHLAPAQDHWKATSVQKKNVKDIQVMAEKPWGKPRFHTFYSSKIRGPMRKPSRSTLKFLLKFLFGLATLESLITKFLMKIEMLGIVGLWIMCIHFVGKPLLFLARILSDQNCKQIHISPLLSVYQQWSLFQHTTLLWIHTM